MMHSAEMNPKHRAAEGVDPDDPVLPQPRSFGGLLRWKPLRVAWLLTLVVPIAHHVVFDRPFWRTAGARELLSDLGSFMASRRYGLPIIVAGGGATVVAIAFWLVRRAPRSARIE